jgi:hypothetical protein
MRKSRTALLLATFSVSAVACSQADTSAEDELLLSAISGEEDYLSGAQTISEDAGDVGAPGGEEARAEGDRQGPPPMFRECDAQGTYTGLFSAYDEDDDQQLGPPEQDEVMNEHAGPEHGPRGHLLGMLRIVYDIDADGIFSEEERATLLEDFTVRCGAIQERVLAEFDVDGSGDLDEAEREAAHEAHVSRMDAAREEMEACRDEMGPDERERPEDGGERGERGDGPPPIRGPLADEFDADGDGEVSESELATLRETMRERIRSGEHPNHECPIDTESESETESETE